MNMSVYIIYLFLLHLKLLSGLDSLISLALQVFLYPQQQLVVLLLKLSSTLLWNC